MHASMQASMHGVHAFDVTLSARSSCVDLARSLPSSGPSVTSIGGGGGGGGAPLVAGEGGTCSSLMASIGYVRSRVG